MAGLTDLNTYSEEELDFTDDRSPTVIFAFPEAEDQETVILLDGNTTAPTPYEIVEIVNPSSANVRYEINVSGVTGTTVAWDPIPAGCTVTSASGIYTIDGIDSIATWDIVKSPTITVPASFNGSFFYTITIYYTTSSGLQTYSYDVGIYVPVGYLESEFSTDAQGDRVRFGVSNLTSFFTTECEPDLTWVTFLEPATFTLDVTGEVLTIDTNSQYLELALPFESTYQFDDVSYLYLYNNNTASITNNVSSPGNLTIDSTYSKFYGESYYATSGAGDKTNYTLANSFSSTDDYTIEFWIRPTKTTVNPDGEVLAWTLGFVGSHSGESQLGFNATNNGFNFISDEIQSNCVVPLNTTSWVHIAITPDGWWKNGTSQGANNLFFTDVTLLHIGQQKNADGNDFEGNIQDFRFYRGVKKYTFGNSFDEDAYGNILEYI